DKTLLANRQLATTGATTIESGQTLVLAGGSLTTGTLAGPGSLLFAAGSLRVTNGSLTVGAGAVPATFALGSGSSLSVSGDTSVVSGGLLTVGGTFTSGTFTNAG